MNLGREYTWWMNTPRKPYPSDVTDDEWQFVVPYLTPMRLDAPQRDHDLRAVFNAVRWIVRAGAGWRMLPHDSPPWEAVSVQSAVPLVMVTVPSLTRQPPEAVMVTARFELAVAIRGTAPALIDTLAIGGNVIVCAVVPASITLNVRVTLAAAA